MVLIEEPADVGLEDPTLALGHDKAEGLHQSADLIGEVGRNIEKLSTGGRDRLREHGVAALDAHLLVPAGANEMRQPIGVVGIGLVGPHIERALGSPSIKAYHRQPTFTQFRPEPGGQRPGLEADPHRTRRMLADGRLEFVGMARTLTAPDAPASFVKNVNLRLFQ